MKSCIKDPCVWVRKRVRPISHRRAKSIKRMNYERCTVTTGKRVRQPDEAVTQLQHEPQRVRVRAIFAFTLLETDGIVSDDFLMHTHTHTDTHRLLFVYQAGTGQNTKPALICMDIWSVCGCECVWMAKSVHKSVCALWSQSSKFNIKSRFSVCIWCNAVVAVMVGLGWGIQFPLFKFNLCAAFW